MNLEELFDSLFERKITDEELVKCLKNLTTNTF